MLDFRMETFLAVCRWMNFTRASEELHITQPAVSQHIKFLEKHYQTKLFRYEGKKLCLTESGELLRGAALTMMRDERSLQDQMMRSKGEVREIRFGVTRTAGETFMTDVLVQFLQNDPNVWPYMQIAGTERLLENLDNGEIEFAILDGRFQKKEYDFLSYITESFIAVSSPSYPFKKNPQQIEDLLGERLLIREQESGTRNVLEQVLQSRNLALKDFAKTAEIASLHTIKELTKSGCGITFLYKTAVQKELERGELKEIPLYDFQVTHEFLFVWRKGSIYADTYRELFGKFSPEPDYTRR